MTKKRVILFKKQDSQDKYNQLLIKHDYIPEFIPVLDHNLENIEILKTILLNGPNLENIQAMILTSQRSVEALSQAYHLIGTLPLNIYQEWNHLPIFIVGPQTAEALDQLPLFKNSHDKKTDHENTKHSHQSHNNGHAHWTVTPRATELIKALITTNYQFLFLAGDKRRDVIPEALNKAHLSFREIQTYATCVHPQLAERMKKPIVADWAVYFSPSGLKFILSAVGELTTQKLLVKEDHPRIAAIGPTTANYIQDDLGLSVDVMAEQPDAEHILKAMIEYDTMNKL
jgi:uroporphyrinogen-III synthase